MTTSEMTLEQRKEYCRNIAKERVMDKLRIIRELREMK